jgi:putative transposase
MISQDTWLYFRFCLGHRDVEESLFARGNIATYEAIRQWCQKYGTICQPSSVPWPSTG